MKKNYLLSIIILSYACTAPAPTAVDAIERSIGFHSNDQLKEFKWHLGTEEPINLVKSLDKVWTARDYAAMKNYFVDTLRITTYNGKILTPLMTFRRI